jgi:hypothetical protein
VLTYIFWGPQIVWWSDYRVVAAPYGNGPALQDTRAFFTASTDEVAREIAVRRHVGLVLACAGEPENQLYDLQRSSLLSRLLGGEPPTWLTPVELPPSLAPAFRLYRLQDG